MAATRRDSREQIIKHRAALYEWRDGALVNSRFVNPALFEPGPESDLFSSFQAVSGVTQGADCKEALETIASLRPKVDLFFDKILVNAPDPNVRQNRLALLHAILTGFSTIADFSEIVTNT